ncbi:hypothetical protein OFN24_29830, partial [Escherichia coli]|nr:hypothetical protein [Escherichia coli]
MVSFASAQAEAWIETNLHYTNFLISYVSPLLRQRRGLKRCITTINKFVESFASTQAEAWIET